MAELQTAPTPAQAPAPPAKKAAAKKYPFYAPRSWHGMGIGTWLGLLWRNRFAVSLTRLPLAFTVSVAAVTNSVLGLMQRLLFGRRIRSTEIEQPPIFILGHWRSGTTHLHELLVLDERFATPTTFECFAPSHCLITGWLIPRLTFLLPPQRPMDNMQFGFDRPQEDEFALSCLGAGSPYETMAFPNRRPVGREFLCLHDVTRPQRDHWQRTLHWFLQLITFRSARQERRRAKRAGLPEETAGPRRIVLKSPPHTARLDAIREMYPNARFIHIVRNPYMVFSSNVRLWKTLWDVQGLQVPKFERRGDRPSVEEYVLDTFNEMYRDFDDQKAGLPANQFCELKYEDLVRAPVQEMRRIYDQLELGGFDEALPKVEAYLAGVKDYQPNRHALPAETVAAVQQHWGSFMRKYGYEAEQLDAAGSQRL